MISKEQTTKKWNPPIARGYWYLVMTILFFACFAEAQGPAPETAPPLFPKGALVSYGSYFTSRELLTDQLTSTSSPTYSHQGNFVFTWGFYPNFDVTINLPIVTNRFEAVTESGGTGVGDMMLLVKYRFYRHDSPRGTTQASFSAGPKLPTGRTDLEDSAGKILPVSLQPGSGSTDLALGFNWTYTGLFGIKRLVADEDFRSLVRSTGSQETRLGNDLESRFWLSYRPYESKDVSHEWFIGPTLTWFHSTDEEIGGIKQPGAGGDVLLTGVTSYVGLAAGVHAWLGVEWAIAHSSEDNFTPARRHISFGITKQFLFF